MLDEDSPHSPSSTEFAEDGGEPRHSPSTPKSSSSGSLPGEDGGSYHGHADRSVIYQEEDEKLSQERISSSTHAPIGRRKSGNSKLNSTKRHTAASWFSFLFPRGNRVADHSETSYGNIAAQIMYTQVYPDDGVVGNKRDANRKEEAAGSESAGAKAYWPWSIFIPITNKKTGNRVADHSETLYGNTHKDTMISSKQDDAMVGNITGVDVIDPELKFDFEEVIKKQDTHDLVCPNSNKKASSPVRSNVPPKTEPLIHKRETEEDVYFRCLSCFSIFVPRVNFGNKNGNRKEETAGSESAGAKAYWPISKRVSDPSDHIEEKNEGNKQPVRDFHDQVGLESVAPAQHIGQILPSETFDGSTPKNTVIPSKQKQDDAMVGNITGGDVILQVAPEPGSTTGVETREGQGWDIIKSIVYGGLMESITSLGVVSSAAGAGATTLSILALGMVNLIAGLLIFCHNLRELKNEQCQWNEESRYQKLLGRRGNLPLHASLAVISFLFFGLLPPIIYGFSFCESDNKDLKLEAVLGASLICITLLAIDQVSC
ncbi:hypothetical protein Pint_26479 [Pistacia integerrima]|uniref:Uncharacterized protein n=1 Tax=Pistacia integerrima TaxID=434235 RepID=A0ACC0YIS1_9ROSI|nr:hypothetical protein Pint_26479 [Pistacia integerrima]